jgi:hypothetical protein
MKPTLRHVIVAMLFGFLPASCAMNVRGTEPASVGATLKAGEWGGQHIAMTVAAAGTEIEFDCGKATVTGTIETDRDGGFTVTGTFLQERPGPTTREGPARRPVRLAGSVKGDDMQIKVVLTDQNEEVGTFALSFGGTARLVKCR